LTGVIRVPELFWHTALNNEFIYWNTNPSTIEDRLYEHVDGFSGYTVVPLELDSVIEIGAGPFTQIQYLLTPWRHIKRITLLEPNAKRYMKMNNCKYKGGHLNGQPITIISESIETLMNQRRKLNKTQKLYYSVVVSTNVVEHVHNALDYFRGMFDLLDVNGLLIFHERWYHHPRDGDCVLDDAESLHPIRITKYIVDTFLEQFDPIFVNLNKTMRQQQAKCNENGLYFIGRKKNKNNCIL